MIPNTYSQSDLWGQTFAYPFVDFEKLGATLHLPSHIKNKQAGKVFCQFLDRLSSMPGHFQLSLTFGPRHSCCAAHCQSAFHPAHFPVSGSRSWEEDASVLSKGYHKSWKVPSSVPLGTVCVYLARARTPGCCYQLQTCWREGKSLCRSWTCIMTLECVV